MAFIGIVRTNYWSQWMTVSVYVCFRFIDELGGFWLYRWGSGDPWWKVLWQGEFWTFRVEPPEDHAIRGLGAAIALWMYEAQLVQRYAFFGKVWTWASQVVDGKVKQPAEEFGTWSSVRHSGAFQTWSLELWLTASDFPRQLLAYDLQVPYAHQVGKGRMVCSS